MAVSIKFAGSGATHSDWVPFAARKDLDLRRTFECGQCFRWSEAEDGSWSGCASSNFARLRYIGDTVYIRAPESKSEFWRAYFDLDRDYDSISFGDVQSEYFDRCVDFGKGIRILRQNSWEALCSFIISQCNNIPRIRSIIATLCREFGERLQTPEGDEYHAFPAAETLAVLEAEDLAPLRSGYRAKYIVAAARAVATVAIDLVELAGTGDYSNAMRELKRLPGIGEKVANCVALFGLGILSGFPIDVWMRRALKEHFQEGFEPARFGEYAGLAQQYIFYHARSSG